MGFHTCKDPHGHHHKQDTKQSHHNKEFLQVAPLTTAPSPLPNP